MGNVCCQDRTNEPTSRVELPKPPRPEFTAPGTINIQYKSSCSFLPLTAPIEKLYRSLAPIEKGEHWSTAFVEEVSTGKRYRLKTVALETAGHRLESIKKEVAIMNKLDHPNISKAKAVFQTNNTLYLLSESGEISLQSHLFTTLSLSEVHAAQVMKQVFSLVAYCHSQNFILLDLSLNSFHLTSKTSLDVRLVDLEGACALEGGKERPETLKEWLAPETLRRSYDQKCDLWSCGYMLFFLISGESPYLMNEFEDLEAKIRSGDVTYSSRRWSGRTKELTALLSRLLSRNPAERPSALECLRDPWIRHFCAEDKYPDMHRVTEQLQLYQPSKQWNRAVGTFVLQRVLSEEHLKAKTALFKALDHDSDGFINQNELADALKSVMPADKAAFVSVQILASLDSNHDGLIDFSEFLLAVTDEQLLLSPEHLNKAFNAIDLNHDGYVTLADLLVYFEAEEEATWRALLMKIGKRPQDQLRYTEFVTLLSKR